MVAVKPKAWRFQWRQGLRCLRRYEIFLKNGFGIWGSLSPPSPVPGGSLMGWAHSGVLLLNTCLTVEEGRPNSHSGQGWEVLTDAVIRAVSQGARPVAFLLWGANAQSKKSLIDDDRHLVLTANHPSPLSAMRPPIPFLGCSHFSRALAWQKSLEWDVQA